MFFSDFYFVFFFFFFFTEPVFGAVVHEKKCITAYHARLITIYAQKKEKKTKVNKIRVKARFFAKKKLRGVKKADLLRRFFFFF